MLALPVMGSGMRKDSSGMQLAYYQEGCPHALFPLQESLGMEISGSASFGASRASGKITMAPVGALLFLQDDAPTVAIIYRNGYVIFSGSC